MSTLSTGRRTVFKAAAAAAVTALTPIGLATAQPAAPPRNRTMTLVWGGREGRWVDFELWNPYSIGSNHQNGPNIIYEPLAYYSAFADKTYMWLAESYQFTPDFKQLTIKTRPGITWRTARRSGRGRRLHAEQPARSGPQGEMGRRCAAGAGGGDGDRRQHGGARFQDPVAAVLLLRDLQIRHRRLHRAEAHLRRARTGRRSSTSTSPRAGR